VNLFLPECQCLQRPKFTGRIKQLGKALAIPEDTVAVLGEILKFLATVALIWETGVILLLAG
jgi:hypothetical protein